MHTKNVHAHLDTQEISLDGYPETSLPDTQEYTRTHTQVYVCPGTNLVTTS